MHCSGLKYTIKTITILSKKRKFRWTGYVIIWRALLYLLRSEVNGNMSPCINTRPEENNAKYKNGRMNKFILNQFFWNIQFVLMTISPQYIIPITCGYFRIRPYFLERFFSGLFWFVHYWLHRLVLQQDMVLWWMRCWNKNKKHGAVELSFEICKTLPMDA